MAYRPFVEEGKVWKVGTVSGNPVQVVDYYYFDGDTIIDGKTCRQMMCQRYVGPDYSNEYWTPTPSLTKAGAWYEENQKVYLYDDGATPEFNEARDRIDFTHTIKIRPKTRIMREEEMTSIYGEYSDQQLGINLDPLDDAYLVSITDETGKAVYEKTVNAGNIVGLNIDISAYAKGRYTVTVENSRDLFTGMFDTQTTGIEEVTKKKAEVRGEIYNLQGQQINSLRKGLNIVRSGEGRLQGKSGQKIYVK